MAIDRTILQTQMQSAQMGRGNVSFIKGGQRYRLRFLEFVDSEGKNQFARLVGQWQKNRQMQGEILNRQVTFGATDAVARLREICDEHGVDFPYDRVRKQYYANAIDMNKTPHVVRRYAMPTSVWEQIVNYLLNDQWANILEPEVGHGFEIHSTGSGLETQYTATPTRDPWPVSADMLRGVADPLCDVQDPGLMKQIELLGMQPEELYPNIGEIEDIAPIVIEKPKTSSTLAAPGAPPSAPVAGVDFRKLLASKLKTGNGAPAELPAAPAPTQGQKPPKPPKPAPAAAPQEAPPATAETPKPATAAGRPPVSNMVANILNRTKQTPAQ